MCERIELKSSVRELSRHFGRLQISARDLPQAGELSAATPLLIICGGSEGARASNARWGLVGHFLDQSPRSPLLNLRSEGLADTPFYGRLLRRKRCLVPASAFYCWQHHDGRRVKTRISHADGQLLLLAGIFDHHPHAGTTCTILTRATGHPEHGQRLPVLLPPAATSFWLAEHPEFPNEEFSDLLLRQATPPLTLTTIPEPEPSPQLTFNFAFG